MRETRKEDEGGKGIFMLNYAKSNCRGKLGGIFEKWDNYDNIEV